MSADQPDTAAPQRERLDRLAWTLRHMSFGPAGVVLNPRRRRPKPSDEPSVRLPCPEPGCDCSGVGVDEEDAREALLAHAEEDH